MPPAQPWFQKKTKTGRAEQSVQTRVFKKEDLNERGTQQSAKTEGDCGNRQYEKNSAFF